MDNRFLNNKYLRFFTSPFCENLPYLLLLWVILSMMNVYGWSKIMPLRYTMYFSAWNFWIAYILILVLPLLKIKWIKRTYLSVAFFIASISAMVDYFFWVILQRRDYFQVPEIVRNTNLNEVREFVSHNVDLSLVIPVLGLGLVLVALFYVTKIVAKSTKYNIIGGIIVSLFCLMLCAHYPYSRIDSIIGKTKYWVDAFTRKTPDLKDYYHDLTVDVNGDLPDNLVIIIGETFSRHHSSLYGYEKLTNPLLSEIDTTSLFVFPDVESAGLCTLASFIKFMNDSKAEHDERQWYECLTIQELLSKSGYHSKWVSNQNRVGICDNEVTAFANLTDEQYFIKDKALNFYVETYDGELLPLLQKAISDSCTTAKNLYWIQLIGSHTVFEKRYPADFKVFTEQDYASAPKNQRSNLAHYDNSVLYNDFVIDAIFNEFKDKNALVIYFSDHGFDIYYSDPTYCNYGRDTDAKSAKMASQIPFMIYTSESLKATNPEIMSRITSMQNQPLNTNDLLTFISKLLDISYSY